MNNRDLDLVRASAAKLAPHLDDLVDVFYRRLFTDSPELRPMFTGDLAAQRAKLANMLAFVLGKLDRIDDLQRPLQNLGCRHDDYGVRAHHYAPVGAALLAAIAEVGGPVATPEVLSAWSRLYGVLAETMQGQVAARAS